ncbi:MAG: aldo/keto reductase [Lachnospiraceae bacterium]|jgi:predicted aldo/keto reductase-like oxidoreductase|nr:aldo/keto reductase [Lachnospiraceae bacterium]
MNYRKDIKSGNELSILGFGCMRLPGAFGKPDMKKSEELLMTAYNNGINYFDTAYLYPGVEETVGAIFAKNGIRDKVNIAAKLPHGLCKKYEDFDRFFNIELERLQTEYIDYYLVHNITSFAVWQKAVDLGIKDWIRSKKETNKVRRIGFSFHGPAKDFPKIIDDFDFDFVQIQYNYINTNYQAGTEGLKYAHSKGLPVIIMEPLLGGKLVNGLPEGAIKEMNKTNSWSPAKWGLKWLYSQKEVTVVLSGMNEMKQLEENLQIVSDEKVGEFSEEETETIERVIKAFEKAYKVRCTGCNYCQPCTVGINIPACFTAYNNSYAINWMAGEFGYITQSGAMSGKSTYASDCIACGKCEKQCPQHIEIIKELKNVKRRFEIPGLKTGVKIANKIMRK